MCKKYYRKSCKYMSNNSTRRKRKKIQLHNFKVSSTMVWRYMSNKDWKALKRKKRRTCRHGARRIWKLYSKRRPADNSRDVNPLETILTISNEKTYKDRAPKTEQAKTVTTLRLEKCALRHALGAHTFYTSPLIKCQTTSRKTFWLLIFQLFNVK